MLKLLCVLWIALVAMAMVTWSMPTKGQRKRFKDRRELIERLPNITTMPKFNMYSGYLQGGSGMNLFYWLTEAKKAPSDILILWLNGGPGCSSMFGLLKENGPLMIDDTTQEFVKNRYSWNRLGHVLYLDSPVGAGFSYADGEVKASQLDDHKTAASNLAALNHFLELYPRYKDAKLYLMGESYAGIYVPTLATAILNENGRLARNLKGIALGNPLLDLSSNEEMQIDFCYNHGVICKDLKDELLSDNCRNNKGTKHNKKKCRKAYDRFRAAFEDPVLNIYNFGQESECKVKNQVPDIFDANYGGKNGEEYYPNSDTDSDSDFLEYYYADDGYDYGNYSQDEYAGVIIDSYNKGAALSDSNYQNLSAAKLKQVIMEAFAEKNLNLKSLRKGYVPGEDYLDKLKESNDTSDEMEKIKGILESLINETKYEDETHDCQIKKDFVHYLRRDDVQEAIHAKPIQFKACSETVGSFYARNVENVTEHIQRIYNANIFTLFYYGDQDIMCPFKGGETFLSQLDIKRTHGRRPWYVNKRETIGGYFEKFGHLWLSTVRAAGHMSPSDKPKETFTLIRRFIKHSLKP